MKKLLLALFSFLLISALHAQSIADKYQVEIVRDSFGVPHIFGHTDADVAFGLEWAACEDDFTTVQWGLLISKGMLGRYLGIDGAKIDYAVQLLRVRQTIDERYEKDLSPEFRKLLEAAADAGNLYAKQHPDKVLVKAALPVKPQDFIAGYMLSMALMTGVDGALNTVVNGQVPEVPFSEKGRGSNGIAMNSKITADGQVYLDVNSHQPLEGPLSWYEAHLHSDEGWNIIGSTFHGAITIFHGVNENLGWAHTTNGFDAIDIFKLEPDPNKKNCYLVDGKSYPLEVKRVKLSVNLAKNKKNKFILTVGKKAWWSMYGATVVTKQGMYAVRLASNMTIKSPEQWYRMNKARNYTEFRKALDMQGIVNQNIIYGDKNDTIFIISNGAMPKRANGYDWSTTVPGNTMKTLWTDFLPEDSLAQTINPSCGYVFNANNTSYEQTCMDENPDPAKINPNIGYDKDENNRSRRFYENISQYSKVDWNDFLKIKYDSKYPAKPAFLKKFEVYDLFDLKEADYPEIADALSLLHKWNRGTAVTDTNAAFFIKIMYQLYNNCNEEQVKLYHDNHDEKVKYFIKCIQNVTAEMMADFGTLNIPLGEYQRHVRGNVDMAIDGGPDLWNAKYGNPYQKGKVKIWLGESFILLARFTKNGPVIRTVSPYGSSNMPNSPHYTDQMPLYVNHQTKEESLDKDWAYKHAERIYKPGKN
jgi:acyl-homoserine-lactone acylase